MRSARLSLALETGALHLPTDGRIAVYRPRIGDDLSALPQDRVVVLTGFKPDQDHFAARYSVVPEPPYAGAIVCLPRSREAARALIARAAAEVAPGGVVAVDGQKTDGIDTALKDLRGRVDLSESLSKAHGKLASFVAGPDLSDWLARPHQVDGFQTLPGIFSADGPDRGSVLLAGALPVKLGGKVADLGAGWGWLSMEVLRRCPDITSLDAFEVDARALEPARRNLGNVLVPVRPKLFWKDVTAGVGRAVYDFVVMNPPFHEGRDAEPGLGLKFITAAATALKHEGELWMVANKQLPYEVLLESLFDEVTLVSQREGFKVLHASGVNSKVHAVAGRRNQVRRRR